MEEPGRLTFLITSGCAGRVTSHENHYGAKAIRQTYVTISSTTTTRRSLPSASSSRRTTLHTSPPLRPVYNFSSSTSGLRNAKPPDGPACNRCYNFATTVSAGAAPSAPLQSFTTFVVLIRDKCQYTLGAGDGWAKTRGDRWEELSREIFPAIIGKVSIFGAGDSDGWCAYRPRRIALWTDTRM